MVRRSLVPLSLKLAATSIALVLATSIAAAWLGEQAIHDVGERAANKYRALGEQTIRREARQTARRLADSLAIPLARSMYGDVEAVTRAAMDAERGERAVTVLWVLVSDGEGPVASAGELPEQATLASLRDELARVDDLVAADHSGSVYRTAIVLDDAEIGSVLLGIDTAHLDAVLSASLAQASRRAAETTRELWLAAGLLLSTAALLALVQGVRLGRPLRRLAAQADAIAQGQFDLRVPVTGHDEIATLASSFNSMADALEILMSDREHQAVLRNELDLARSVQERMLPPSSLLSFEGVHVVGVCRPAAVCGGDWWTVRRLRSGRLLVVVGDVTGHGLASAMVASTAHGAIDALLEVDHPSLSPRHVLLATHRAIRQVCSGQLMMTCVAAILDTTTGVVEVANAGHNFPLIIRASSEGTLTAPLVLPMGSTPLGGDTADGPMIATALNRLADGDLFVAFTDGIVEAESTRGRQFGDRRLAQALIDHGGGHGPALITVRDRVIEAVERFSEGLAQADDQTLVLCQFTSPVLGSNRPVPSHGGSVDQVNR